MVESGASTQSSVVGVSILSHSAVTLLAVAATTVGDGAAVIMRLMASATATSIYIARTGHTPLLVIKFLL